MSENWKWLIVCYIPLWPSRHALPPPSGPKYLSTTGDISHNSRESSHLTFVPVGRTSLLDRFLSFLYQLSLHDLVPSSPAAISCSTDLIHDPFALSVGNRDRFLSWYLSSMLISLHRNKATAYKRMEVVGESGLMQAGNTYDSYQLVQQLTHSVRSWESIFIITDCGAGDP